MIVKKTERIVISKLGDHLKVSGKIKYIILLQDKIR